MIKLITILIFLIYFFSCTKNKYTIIDERETTFINHDDSEKYIINFYPRMKSINGYGMATGYVNFPKGCLVDVYAYSNDSLISEVSYKSFTEASISPVSIPLELFLGIYNIYLTSIHSSSEPPTFTDGKTTDIENDKIYLWYEIKKIDITAPITLPVYFNRSSVQVFVSITNPDSTTVAENIETAMMGTPVISSNMYWNLFNGVITPSTSINTETLTDMTVSKLDCWKFIVPVANTSSLYFYVSVNIKDQNKPQDYIIDLPIPDSTFIAGRCYKYDILFTNDTVYLDEVYINPWIEIDETGTPIYPNIEPDYN